MRCRCPHCEYLAAKDRSGKLPGCRGCPIFAAYLQEYNSNAITRANGKTAIRDLDALEAIQQISKEINNEP